MLQKFVFAFSFVLSLVATSCSEREDCLPQKADSNISRSFVVNADGDTIWYDISLKADDAWKGEYYYDMNGNLLFTVTACGDTIWNSQN